MQGEGVPRGAPLISVIITVHDRRRYIAEALRSVIAQDLPRSDFEVILVTNLEEESIDAFCTQHGIRQLKMDAAIGKAYFEATQEARGSVLAFLDDDDLWMPHRLLRIAEVFRLHPRVGYFHNQYDIINSSGQRTSFRRNVDASRHTLRSRVLHFDHLESGHRIRDLLRISAEFNHSSIAVRRDLLLPYLPELRTLVGGADSFLFFLACLSGFEVYCTPESLTEYRISPKNLSWGASAEARQDPIRRQLPTYRRLIEISNRKGTELATVVRQYLRLIEAENEALFEIFRTETNRRRLAEKLAAILRIRGANHVLRNRVLAFGALGLILSPQRTQGLYFRWNSLHRPR